ncbi:hypothetical protein [Thauera sp. Sel9]|uniref:hypothetical protein n=1 Tax=Thauera sp. Sel9 TaxID=2974299 RepID=UPI0021E1A2B7|nr:hypothetical protein [Thauera sp. Sel9]MCV2219290.1 hypothetical protein [Thauera sp. Sel9]
MQARHTMLGVLALLLLLSACAGTRKAEIPQDSTPTLEQMRQAVLDFARASDAGDALEMARAAAARRPFDVLARDASFLTSSAMFEKARQRAAGDSELLRQIARLERTGSSLGGLMGGAQSSLLRRFAERSVPFVVVEDELVLREPDSGAPPAMPSDCGAQGFGPSSSRVLKVGAKSSLVLCGDVRAGRTLFVYAEGGLDVRLMLRVFDLGTAERICAENQPNPICKWPRPAKATRAVVEIGNPGRADVSVTLIAHQ